LTVPRPSPSSSLCPCTPLFRSLVRLIFCMSVAVAWTLATLPASVAAPPDSAADESPVEAPPAEAAESKPGSTQPSDKPLSAEQRSEEHTSELQSRENLVCRLLL